MKLHEPFTFFVDRSLGRCAVVEALRQASFDAHAHDDFFAQDTPDATWLVDVGRRGWVVLAKDKAMRHNELELAAILGAQVACFSLGRGDAKSSDMAACFIATMPAIHRALRRFHVPIIATVTQTHRVHVHYAGGKRLPKPRELR